MLCGKFCGNLKQTCSVCFTIFLLQVDTFCQSKAAVLAGGLESCRDPVVRAGLSRVCAELKGRKALDAGLEPLAAASHERPDKWVGLYSRSNCRTIALQMLQACRRDIMIKVPCSISCIRKQLIRHWHNRMLFF